jgi:hypothetical protein
LPVRFSRRAGHPVNQPLQGLCSIYYGRFANASGRPTIVHPLTKGFALCLRRSSNLFTEIVTVTRRRPKIGKRSLINEKNESYQWFDKYA